MREIKSPEDVTPILIDSLDFENGDGEVRYYVPAEEVGQIISLAMDAERDKWNAGEHGYDAKMKLRTAWRALADRLMGLTVDA